MAKASEQFRQSDVATWGVVALVCGGLAVLGSNISAVIPQSIIGGLHQPRVAGSSIEALRQQVAELTAQTTRLQTENAVILARVSLQEKGGNDVVRRVGALEVSLPKLLESLPDTALVDRSAVTASIRPDGSQTFNAEGGSVSVRQAPMAGSAAQDADMAQPLPDALPQQVAAIAPAPASYGVALGAAVPENGTEALWADLNIKLGPLLLGLVPLISDDSTTDLKRIVVGPFEELSVARALCERFERVSIACAPSAYTGTVFDPVGDLREGG